MVRATEYTVLGRAEYADVWGRPAAVGSAADPDLRAEHGRQSLRPTLSPRVRDGIYRSAECRTQRDAEREVIERRAKRNSNGDTDGYPCSCMSPSGLRCLFGCLVHVLWVQVRLPIVGH